MFGRLRPPSSSLDSLESERSHSKFFKDDSLSVYEATLMKLKLGSQRAARLPPHPDDPMDAETDSVSASSSTPSTNTSLESMSSTSQTPAAKMAGNCSSSTISPASSASLAAGGLKHQVSVLELFSKYKVSRQDDSIPSRRCAITTMSMDDNESENNSPSSVSFPPPLSSEGSSSIGSYSADGS